MDNVISVKSFVKSIAGFSIASWSSFIIGIIAVSLTTRLFNPEIMGGINQFNNVSSLLVGVCCLGFDNSFIRFYYHLPDNVSIKELLVKCILSSIFVMLIVSFFMIVISDTVSMHIFGTCNIFLIILLCLNAFSMMVIDRYLTLMYRMSKQIKKYNVCQILINITSRLFVLLAAFSSPDIETVCLYNTLGICILTLLYCYIQRGELAFKRDFINMHGYKIIFRFAITSWPTNILVRFNQFIIPFIIGMYLGNYDVGIYASALFFCSAFSVLSNGFGVYWAPFMYKNYNTQQTFIKNVHDYIIVFSILLMLFIFMFKDFAYCLIGNKFHESIVFFTFLLLEPICNMIAGTTGYGISIKNKNEEMTIIYFLCIIFNIILSIIFINKFGLLGISIGLGFVSCVRFMLVSLRGQKYYRSIHSWKKTVIGIIILFLLALSNTISFFCPKEAKIFLLCLIVIAAFNYKHEVCSFMIPLKRFFNGL